MHAKQYIRQIEKRKRIGTGTLIIGMDIGSKSNAVCLMDKEGRVIGQYPTVFNSRKGFEFFRGTVEDACARNGFTDVIVGMEPTGHYWRKIAFFARDKGYEIRFVRTTALKHQRELDESSSAKNDARDSFTIANIVREGKYIDTIIEDGIFRQLRTLSHARERMVRYNTGSKHALKAALDDYFPELPAMFSSMDSQGLLALVGAHPFPRDVCRAGFAAIERVLRKSMRRTVKARMVYEAARESVGLKDLGDADRVKLAVCLDEVVRSKAKITEMKKEITGMLCHIPFAEHILSIPGVGHLTCGVFLGELGNPDHFRTPRQIIKYAGYDPKENDSGLWKGRKVISKKGRWLLRKYLYFMAMRIITRSTFFRDYYEKKVKGHTRPLVKKEALCAVILKLIRVIFALVRDKRLFSEDAAGRAKAA